MSVKNSKHDQLQDIAIGWLYARGCSIFAKEVPTSNGIADALGVKTPPRYLGESGQKDTVYYIEAKTSRSDLICLKQKSVYRTSVGWIDERCYYHRFPMLSGLMATGANECDQCRRISAGKEDTGIDFYYLIVSDGVAVEKTLYPEWGVINERGKVIRKAKRMRRENDVNGIIVNVAHVLVYKVFGKMYQ